MLTGEKMFSEKGDAGSMSRYSKTMKLEGEFTEKDLTKADVRKEAQEKLKKVFEDSRKN